MHSICARSFCEQRVQRLRCPSNLRAPFLWKTTKRQTAVHTTHGSVVREKTRDTDLVHGMHSIGVGIEDLYNGSIVPGACGCEEREGIGLVLWDLPER